MFINFWYAAEESDNVTEVPVHVQMLGQDFVLFRDTEGKAHCLSNVCVHRGGSLAHGKVKGDCVECPYHGWQFDGSGNCTRIPSMGPDAKIPSRAKVDAYPTFEKYGLIFAFLGDLPEAERPPVMQIPEWDDETWRSTYQRFEFDFNFERSLENSVDLAHNEFVHALQLHIDGESFAIPDFELEEYEDGWEHGFRMTMPGQSGGIRKDAGKTKPGPSTVYTAFHGVSSFRTLIHPAPHIKMHQYIFETPVEDAKTRLFFINMRSFMIDESADERMIGENADVAYEDRDVLQLFAAGYNAAYQCATKRLYRPTSLWLVTASASNCLNQMAGASTATKLIAIRTKWLTPSPARRGARRKAGRSIQFLFKL